ncbi:MAG TPA: hypothetical protein VGK25_05055 [Ignavibacteria bacterium]
MKTIILLLVLTLISGCSKVQKKPETSETKKDTTSQIQSSTSTVPQGANDNNEQTKPALINVEYGISKLPTGLSGYEGKIMAMAKWEDKLGANVVFITETSEKYSGDDNRHKELYGYHYITSDDANKLLWKINDFIKDCPVDITIKYIDESLSITDLDNNGIGESSFLYRMSCKGDVSPDAMKLLMHEGETKYAIRGEMKLEVKGEGTYGGKMEIDPSFDKAPGEFLEFARSQWNKYKDEKVGY